MRPLEIENLKLEILFCINYYLLFKLEGNEIFIKIKKNKYIFFFKLDIYTDRKSKRKKEQELEKESVR